MALSWTVAATTIVVLVATPAARALPTDPAAGTITTAAGTAVNGFAGDGGPATSALLSSPAGVDFGADGTLYLADRGNGRVRRIDASTGIITTLAGGGSSVALGDGGPAGAAFLYGPSDVAVGPDGDLFVADTSNHKVRRVDLDTGIITTVAGRGGVASGAGFAGDGGPATAAALFNPTAIDLTDDGDLYIYDSTNARVRRVDAVTGIITTIAGSGVVGFAGDGGLAVDAAISRGNGLVVAPDGDVFLADTENHRVRQVDAQTGAISTIAGTGLFGSAGDGGPAVDADLIRPSGLDLDGEGHLYIAANGNSRVRRVDAATGVIGTVVGTITGDCGDGGPAIAACISQPESVAVSPSGLLAVDSGTRVAIATPPAGLPAPPASISTEYDPGGCCRPAGIAVTWTASTSPVNRQRVTASPGGTSLLLGGTSTQVTVTDVLPGTDYTISVEAFDGWSFSPAAVATFRTPGDPPAPPDAPAGVTATSAPGEIGVEWVPAPGGAPAESYEVEWHEVGDDYYVIEAVPTSPFSVAVAGAGPYGLRVRGVNGTGPGPWSEWVTATPTTINRAPSAVDDEFVVVDQGLPREFEVVAPGVLANDTDPDGDDLVVTQLSTPPESTAEIDIGSDGALRIRWSGTLCEPISADYEVTDGLLDARATLTVRPARPCLIVTAPIVAEGAFGELTPAPFGLALSFDPDGPALVRATTVDGSAIAGEDYVPLDVLVDARSTDVLPGLVVGDSVIEPNEFFFLELDADDVVVIGDAVQPSGLVPATIVDDDAGSPYAVALQLLEAGGADADVVRALDQTFRLTTEQVVEVLLTVGLTVDRVVAAVRSALKTSWQALTVALEVAGATAAEVLAAFVAAGLKAQAALAQLRQAGWDTSLALGAALSTLAADSVVELVRLARLAGYGLDTVAGWLSDTAGLVTECAELVDLASEAGHRGDAIAGAVLRVDDQTPSVCAPLVQESYRIGATLRAAHEAGVGLIEMTRWMSASSGDCVLLVGSAVAAGFGEDELAAALFSGADVPAGCLWAALSSQNAASTLHQAGVDAVLAAGIVADAFASSLTELAATLVQAGYLAADVAHALRQKVGAAAAEVYSALSAAGVALVDAALVIQAEFRLRVNRLADLLVDAGIDLPADLSLAELVAAVLSVLGVTWDRIIVMATDRGLPLEDVLDAVWSLIRVAGSGGVAGLFELLLATIGADLPLEEFEGWLVERVGVEIACPDLIAAATQAGYGAAPIGALVSGPLGCAAPSSASIIAAFSDAGATAADALAAAQVLGATSVAAAAFWLTGAGYAIAEAATALRTVLKASIQEVADALWAIGVSSTDTALALLAVFSRTSLATLTARLYDALYNDSQVADALGAIGGAASDFARFARQRGRQVVAVGRALVADFSLTVAEAAATLLGQRWSLAAVVASMKDLGLDAQGTILLLWGLGVSAADAAQAVAEVFGSPANVPGQVGEWLFDAGATSVEIAETLAALGQTSFETASRLAMLGLTAVETGAAMLVVWGLQGANWLTKRLVGAGYQLGTVFDAVFDLVATATFDDLVTASRQQLVAMGRTLTEAAQWTAEALTAYTTDLDVVATLLAAGGYLGGEAALALSWLSDQADEVFLAVRTAYPSASASQLLAWTESKVDAAAGWLYDEAGETLATVSSFVKGAGASSSEAADILFDLGADAATSAMLLADDYGLSNATLVSRLLGAGHLPVDVAQVMADLGQSATWIAQRLRLEGVGAPATAEALVAAFTLTFNGLVQALLGGGFAASAAQVAACAVLGC